MAEQELRVREQELIGFMRSHVETVLNALRNQAKRMDEAAATARRAFVSGEANALVTNQGFRMSAELFEQDAAKAREVAEALSEHVYGLDDDEGV